MLVDLTNMLIMRTLLKLFVLILPFSALAQVPNDEDSICPITIYNGNFEESGFEKGDEVEDFILYDLQNQAYSFNKDSLLKPVLLINGSYTCPVFRNKINTINSIWNDYKNLVDIKVIYTVEAHPETDISPYSGNVWTTQQNYDDEVLYRQALTYGDRKSTALDMVNATELKVPVILDDTCNTWWLKYGPAPQNAYLIDTNGRVFSKHPWFDRSPSDIECDLDSLLFQGSCNQNGNQGILEWTLIENDTISGSPNDVLTIKGIIVNSSTTDDALVGIYRLQNNIPLGWSTAMCTDICLDSGVDTTFVSIAPLDTQWYTMYFYTDETPDQGSVRIGFRNENVAGNQVAQYFFGSTDNSVGIIKQEKVDIRLMPNPVKDELTIQLNAIENSKIRIFNLMGEMVYFSSIEENFSRHNLNHLPEGIYTCIIETMVDIQSKKLIIQ